MNAREALINENQTLITFDAAIKTRGQSHHFRFRNVKKEAES